MESYNIIRIIVVCISGLCIYFGYKLFYLVTERQGKLKIDGKEGSVSLSDVGPGVFFALFGSIVMVVTLVTQPYAEKNKEITGADGSITRTASRTPASADGGSLSEIEMLCVNDETSEIFNQGLEILKELAAGKSASPYAQVDPDVAEKTFSFLKKTGGSDTLVGFMTESNSYHDYYFALMSHLISIYVVHRC